MMSCATAEQLLCCSSCASSVCAKVFIKGEISWEGREGGGGRC